MGIPKGKETVGFVPLRLGAQIREGERTATKPRRFGILLATSPHGVCICLARPLASRPASIRTLAGPAGPLLDGVPRFGGALLS